MVISPVPDPSIETSQPRPPWYFYFLALLITLVTAIVLGEAICRVAGAGRPNRTATGPKQLYIPDPDPQTAFRMRPGYTDFVYGSQVSINPKGLRDYDYPYDKPDGVKRILILGDSVAFGYGARMEDTFAKQWEQWFQKTQENTWEIINSGVPAYTTEQEVRWFEVEGLRYHPDAVVVAYIMNDPEELHPLREDGRLDLIDIDTFYQKMAQLIPRPILPLTKYSYLSKFLNRWLLHAHPNWKTLHEELTQYFCEDIFSLKGWDDCQSAFIRLRDRCQKENIFLFVAIYPTMYRLHSIKDHPFTSHYRRVEEFLIQNDIPCVMPLEDFTGQPVDDMRAYADDPHPSRKSHRIFAQRLHREMQDRWDVYNPKTGLMTGN